MAALQKSDGQTGHLQGWRLSAGDECRVMDGNGQPLVDVKCGGMSGRSVKQGEEIALLIAAAPELLSALRKLAGNAGALGAFECEIRDIAGNTNWACLVDAIEAADAAIRKATGA